MEVATGPGLGSLLAEADEVYKLPSGVKRDIRSLQMELQKLQAALSEIAEVPAYKLDEETKSRAADLRDLSFHIQHAVDNLRDRVRAHRSRMAELQGFKGFAARISFKIASIWARREFAMRIRELKNRLQDGSYNRPVRHAVTEVDDSQSVLDTQGLVGIDARREELLSILAEQGATSSQQLKVVAIVGDGPVGKTTLAKVVYDYIAPQFDLAAWVTLSTLPDIKKILIGMLRQLSQENQPDHFDVMDVKQLIDKIRRTLQQKRYLIVVDNVLDEPEWELVKCTLIDNNNGSAVLMTSRKHGHIAHFVGRVYEVHPLSDVDSRTLLYKRLFGSEDKCPPKLAEIYEVFLEKCGGIPLTIITISRLLESKNSMTNDELSASIYSGLLFDKTVGHELPPYLKPCLLYLSMFQKGCEVNGEHLIWQWLAEGFIHETESEGKNSQELGQHYLNELLNRKLIEPQHVDVDGRVIFWTVKETVHELVIAISTQENFVTRLGGQQQGRPLSSIVNRLSIQGRNAEHMPPEGHLSQVKSLVLFGDSNWMPSLSMLQDLRVLDLGGCHFLQNDDIKDIGSLFHLKCLIIGGKCITHIPEEIGNLVFLETLDLRECGLIKLPERIVQIKQLKRLYVNSGTNIPQRIGKLEALQELGDIKITEPSLLKELHNLTKLRILRIAIWSWDDEKLKINRGPFLENLHSLLQVRQNIQSLSILTCCSLDFLDTQDTKWPPQHLQKIEIGNAAFDKLPTWIDSLHVSTLSIEVNELSQEMIDILGKLPTLRFLSLTSKYDPQGEFGKDSNGFKDLESLHLVSNVMVKMFAPKPEAMQNLKRIKLRFQASLTEVVNHGFSFGFEDLCSLEHVHVELICFNASRQVVNKAEQAIHGAISMCGNHRPNLKIRRVREDDMTEDDKEVEVLHNVQPKQQKGTKNRSSSRKIRVAAKRFRRREIGVARKYKIISLQLKSHILTLQALQ